MTRQKAIIANYEKHVISETFGRILPQRVCVML